jgi:hypothetical protein
VRIGLAAWDDGTPREICTLGRIGPRNGASVQISQGSGAPTGVVG